MPLIYFLIIQEHNDDDINSICIQYPFWHYSRQSNCQTFSRKTSWISACSSMIAMLVSETTSPTPLYQNTFMFDIGSVIFLKWGPIVSNFYLRRYLQSIHETMSQIWKWVRGEKSTLLFLSFFFWNGSRYTYKVP